MATATKTRKKKKDPSRREFMQASLGAALAFQIADVLRATYSQEHVIEYTLGHKTSLVGVYDNRPVDYIREVLGLYLTPDQEEIANMIPKPPHKGLVRAGHSVGKTHICAALVNWWFDTYDPGLCLTTAPTDRQVKDLLWKEVRIQRANAVDPRARKGFNGPKEPRLETRADHFAQGFTARDGSRFVGWHGAAVLIIFDEAVGIAPIFWEAVEPMLGGARYGFLGVYNPTDQSSTVFQEEKEPGYHPVKTMSCVDHPNIKAGLEGKPPPVPNAITLPRLKAMLEKWCTPIKSHLATNLDVKLGDTWYRPGPIAESRLLGRWPTQAINSIWSESLFDAILKLKLPLFGMLQIGCDVARYGDDNTDIHVRKGGCSLWHESHNGWGEDQTLDRLEQLAHEWSTWSNNQKLEKERPIRAKEVPIAVDDTGLGGGVVDFGKRHGFNLIGVNAAQAAPDPNEYPNLRSALWFDFAHEAMLGNISFKILQENCPDEVKELRKQMMAPRYRLDARGRRVVEAKDETKLVLKQSPDGADAVNLSYANVVPVVERVAGRVRVP